MTAPLVSVVLDPTRGDGRLGGALASVLGQTLGDLEVLVPGGVPADLADRRVRQHSGLTVAEALAQARGTWLALLDEDCEWIPTRLEQQLEAAEAAGTADAVGGLVLDIAAGHATLAPAAADSPATPRTAWLVRRDALSGGPGDWSALLARGARTGRLAQAGDIVMLRGGHGAPGPWPRPAPQGPLVSVIVPTHNRATKLRRAIASVLAQTYRNLELIVVDDVSTDDTPAVLAAIADPRLRCLRNDRNRRAAGSRNRGLEAARGELVAFLDDDDFWLARKLERQVAALMAESADVGMNVCGHYSVWGHRQYYVGGERAFRRMRFAEGPGPLFEMIATPAWLVRREPLQRTGGFDENMRCWDDWELALRLNDECRISHLDEGLLVQDRRRESGTGMADDRPAFAHHLRYLQQKHARRWSRAPRVRARLDKTLAMIVLAHGSPAEGRRLLWRSFRTWPLGVQSLGLLLLSLLGGGVALKMRAALKRLRKGKS